MSEENSESPVTLVHIFWCLVFLSPTCVLVLSSLNGNQELEWHVHIMNPKQFPHLEVSQSLCAFRENQNSNSTILQLALGMGRSVSPTISEVNGDWQTTIWFFLAFVCWYFVSLPVQRVKDTEITVSQIQTVIWRAVWTDWTKLALQQKEHDPKHLVSMNSSTLAFTKEAWKTMALDLVKVFNWTLEWSFRVKCLAKIDTVGASVLDYVFTRTPHFQIEKLDSPVLSEKPSFFTSFWT